MMVGGSYLVAALVVLGVVVVLKREIPATLLRDALSFHFIAAIAAGLEPATVKASLLRASEDQAPGDVGARGYLLVSALKGVLAAPFLALLWRFADPHVDPLAWLWLPFVTAAGFAATDLRVLLDVRGRHASAIWLKHGSLGGGLLLLGAFLLAGMPLIWAMGASTAPRLVLVGFVAFSEPRAGPEAPLGPRIGRLLRDVRWVELAGASVIAAVGGSADRVLALRYLAPGAYTAYFLLYEAFSRFWLLPYLLTPIIFARRAVGRAADAFVRRSWLLTATAGGLFVAAVGGTLAVAPDLLARFIGSPFPPAVLAFAAAVVIAGFTQLRIAELQGAGRARRAALLLGLGAAIAIALFYVLIRRFGESGLLAAWLLKSVIEFAATMIWGGGGLADKSL